MTIYIAIPLAVALVGALVWFIATPKWAQVGLGAWVAGLTAFLIRFN